MSFQIRISESVFNPFSLIIDHVFLQFFVYVCMCVGTHAHARVCAHIFLSSMNSLITLPPHKMYGIA